MQEYRVVRVPENLGGQEAGYLLSDGRWANRANRDRERAQIPADSKREARPKYLTGVAGRARSEIVSSEFVPRYRDNFT
jgi:hypothetical protein